jgi:Zn-dependent metalloprotease
MDVEDATDEDKAHVQKGMNMSKALRATRPTAESASAIAPSAEPMSAELQTSETPTATPITPPTTTTSATPTATATTAVMPRTLQLNRTIYDCQGTNNLPGTAILKEGAIATADDTDSNQVYSYFKITLDFLFTVLSRDSLDDAGYKLNGSIHYDDEEPPNGFDNALWTGTQMVFGDGDNRTFGHFTQSLDVIAHELGHGVTQFTANLPYHQQSGALNEHMSDVIGCLVKQYDLKQTADEADWLIGAELLLPKVKARGSRALRDLAAPGTAYRNTAFGSDDQPAHMKDYVQLPDDDDPINDDGGVHVNSGILNHAFYLAAVAVGGHTWEKLGPVWYVTLLDTKLRDYCQVKENYGNCFGFFAGLTCEHALGLFGADVQGKVRQAWVDVGVLTA